VGVGLVGLGYVGMVVGVVTGLAAVSVIGYAAWSVYSSRTR
jgi:hypothetical protein